MVDQRANNASICCVRRARTTLCAWGKSNVEEAGHIRKGQWRCPNMMKLLHSQPPGNKEATRLPHRHASGIPAKSKPQQHASGIAAQPG
eukprot:1159007-Pelagomonas_calceolata.AAC.8